VVSGTQCLKPFRTIGLDVNRLWRHLVTTAFAAQFIAADAGLGDGLLFTAGLLHDVGKFLLAQAFGNPYTDLLSDAQAIGSTLAGQERQVFGFDHAQVGGRLLERWNFSRQLVASVQFHHNPAAGGEHRSLAAAVSLADALAHSAAADIQTDLKTAPESETALALCNLNPQAVTRYEEQIRENVNFVEAMCRIAA
jgi:putative nucleotidyltransferase with HDIG domain